MAEITEEGLVRGGALAARLYVTAVIDDAEARAIFEIKQVFAKMRATYLADLKADPPFALLIAMEQEYRRQQGDTQAEPAEPAAG